MTDHLDSSRPVEAGPTFIRPLVDFLHTEAAGGVALVAATVIALVWANSPWDASYDDLWQTNLTLALGSHELDLDLRDWINDGLMALFFFVVGLEIKRELVEGELRERRRASLPAVAALGGMLVPAALYLAINAGGEGSNGWGIPMATDIAMAIGVLSLLGRRVSASLKLFVLTLSIVDDIGAILVIAVFYTGEIHTNAMAVAVGLVMVIGIMRRAGVGSVLAFTVAGLALWLALHESGVHATLAGAICGLMAPTRPIRQQDMIDAVELADVSSYAAARQTVTMARESVSVVEWLQHQLHPWTGFVIVPLFALANAGVRLDGGAIGDALTSGVAAGVVTGLVIGKLVGVAGFAWLAVRLRIGVLPEDTGWPSIVGAAALAGVGFTVSVFVAGLAFDEATLVDQAKVAILAASLIAVVLGSALLIAADRRRQVRIASPMAPEPERLR